MIKKSNIVIMVVIAMLSVEACAEETVVTNGEKYNVKSNQVRKEKLKDTHLSILGFTVGKNSLAEVEAKLGKTNILPRKEHAPNRICYISDKSNDGTIVVFSAGPIGGWKKITSFSIYSHTHSFKDRKYCQKSSFISKMVGTDSGIQLGLTQKEMRSILGKPSATKNKYTLYYYETKKKLTKKEIKRIAKIFPNVVNDPYADVTSSVELAYHNSLVSYINISKLETL